MGQKVKVIEVEATELDPEAHYIIVCNTYLLVSAEIENMKKELREMGIDKFTVLLSRGSPDMALKVYQVPREEQAF
jgi:hypothetical protein